MRRFCLVVTLLFAACSSLSLDPNTPWTDQEGVALPTGVIDVVEPDPACGWDPALFLWLNWPPGASGADVEERRQYARDPSDRLPQERLQVPFGESSALSNGAAFTGLRSGEVMLWTGPDAEDYVYLVDGARVEAWARSDIDGCE